MLFLFCFEAAKRPGIESRGEGQTVSAQLVTLGPDVTPVHCAVTSDKR